LRKTQKVIQNKKLKIIINLPTEAKTNNMKNIIIVIIAVILVGGGIWFFLTSTPKPEKFVVPEEEIAEEIEAPEKVEDETTDLKCEENDEYFVISREFKPGVSDFLVKSKKSSGQSISCAYIVEEKDFELKNQEATYFLALTDNFFILDRGTAPSPRGLIVYDLASHKEVYAGQYAGPLTVSNDTIIYWAPTDKEVTIDNCPELNDFLVGGLGAGIDTYVSLNLSSLTKIELEEYRCSARQ